MPGSALVAPSSDSLFKFKTSVSNGYGDTVKNYLYAGLAINDLTTGSRGHMGLTVMEREQTTQHQLKNKNIYFKS